MAFFLLTISISIFHALLKVFDFLKCNNIVCVSVIQFCSAHIVLAVTDGIKASQQCGVREGNSQEHTIQKQTRFREP